MANLPRMSLGRLAVFVLAMGLALDVSSRFVSYDRVATRGWEAAGRYEIAFGGPFEPNKRYHSDRAYSANMGNHIDLREYHSETFTTDEYGFRNPKPGAVRPVEIVVVGTSFTAGASLSDEQLYSEHLAKLTGRSVYNAAGAELGDEWRLSELVRRLGLKDGVVIQEYVETTRPPRARRLDPPWFADVRSYAAQLFGSHFRDVMQISRLKGWLLPSPLRLLLFQQFRTLNDGLVFPNSFADSAVRGELTNGDSFVFLEDHVKLERTLEDVERGLGYWRGMASRLHARGLKQMVLLVPSKETVYGPLMRTPLRDGSALWYLGKIEARLRAEGIEVVNLAPPFVRAAREGLQTRSYIYFRDDTHWNGRGAALGARLVAERLEQMH